MPGGDGTGPLGNGANTGWGRGPCRGGRGVGWGRRNRFGATGEPGWMRQTQTRPPVADVKSPAGTEQEWLEQRSAMLRAEQQQVVARLAELERERAD